MPVMGLIRPARLFIAWLLIVLTSAGCDPVVSRRFDVRLSDRPKVSRWSQTVVKIEGELGEVVRIMNEVAATWDFAREPSDVIGDPEGGDMGPHREVGHWHRRDPEGAGLGLSCRLEEHDRVRIYLTRGIASKESPLMRDIRDDLTARLIERFGADNVRVSGNLDKQSLRS